MRPIAASLSLFLAAGTLFALFILADIYLDADGGPKFEADPRSDAAADRIPGPADGDRAPPRVERGGERGGERRVAGPQERHAPQADRRERDLAAAVERVGRERDAERARAAALTDDLASARSAERAAEADLARALARLARTFRDRLAELGRGEAEDGARVGERLRRAADPDAADGAALPAALPAAVRLGMGLAGAGGAAGSGDAADRGSPAPLPAPSPDPSSERSPGAAADPSARVVLPDGVGTHVTVAYARGSEPARKRALALSLALQAEGIDVADPVDAPAPARGGRVTYYYGADRASAERVADLVTAPSPIRGRLPARGRLPRPGTIGIAVAD